VVKRRKAMTGAPQNTINLVCLDKHGGCVREEVASGRAVRQVRRTASLYIKSIVAAGFVVMLSSGCMAVRGAVSGWYPKDNTWGQKMEGIDVTVFLPGALYTHTDASRGDDKLTIDRVSAGLPVCPFSDNSGIYAVGMAGNYEMDRGGVESAGTMTGWKVGIGVIGADRFMLSADCGMAYFKDYLGNKSGEVDTYSVGAALLFLF